MRTQAPPDADAPGVSPGREPTIRTELKSLALVAAVAMGVVAFYLALYAVKDYPMPIGWDTPRYLSQTAFVAERGLGGVPEFLPPPTKTLDSRAAGFPIVVLTLSGLFGVSTFKLAAVVPVAATAAMALAAGALASSALRRRAWELGVVALVVGLSPVAIRLMAPETYTDNLFAAALVVAAMVPLRSVVEDGHGWAATVLLLAAAGMAHPSFFAIVLVVLALMALAYLPASVGAWRRSESTLLGTPAIRIGLAGAGATALAGSVVLGLIGATPDTPKLTAGELRKKIREDLPLYRFWATLPLAAAGATALAAALRGRGASRGRNASRGSSPEGRSGIRFLLTVSLAWTAVVAGGVLLYVAGRLSPAHRFLAFWIPLPILVAVGILALARLLGARLHPLAGAGLAGVLLLGLLLAGARSWFVTLPEERGVEWMDEGKVQDAATAAAYLDAVGVPREDPVVFVVDDTGPNPLSFVPEMAYILRSALPPDRIERAFIYVGDPERYLDGRATYRATPRTYNTNVRRFWPTIRRLLPEAPVALVLSSYQPAYSLTAQTHPDLIVAPNVIALRGPVPAEPVPAPPIPTGPRTIVQGTVLGIGVPLILVLLGLGWALALLPMGVRSFEAVALAPAFGLGFLIMGGVVADTAGIRLGGVGGTLTIVAVAVAGAGAAVWQRRSQLGAEDAAGRVPSKHR